MSSNVKLKLCNAYLLCFIMFRRRSCTVGSWMTKYLIKIGNWMNGPVVRWLSLYTLDIRQRNLFTYLWFFFCVNGIGLKSNIGWVLREIRCYFNRISILFSKSGHTGSCAYTFLKLRYNHINNTISSYTIHYSTKTSFENKYL